jgi:hypothetical protein
MVLSSPPRKIADYDHTLFNSQQSYHYSEKGRDQDVNGKSYIEIHLREVGAGVAQSV